MKFITFTHVEDYIEVISGRVNLTTKKLDPSIYWFTPIIQLARYDTVVLSDMCDQVMAGNPLTVKQGALAKKLVLTYRRQLAGKNIDVSPVESPIYRTPLRVMDYRKLLSIENDRLVFRFPYDEKLIADIKAFKKASQGSCEWTAATKLWTAALTEFNLNWAHTWAKINSFEIDPLIGQLASEIVQIEKSDFAIELHVDEDKMAIRNCPDSLKDHINTKLGGFGLNNLLKLVDYSPILGYTVEPALAYALIQEYGPRTYSLATHREIKITPSSNQDTVPLDLKLILDYAILVGRTPVVIYEPNHGQTILNRLHDWYPADYTQNFGNNKDPVMVDGVRFIYSNKSIRNMPTIPLVISTAGLVFGGDKQMMLQSAEKVVYMAVDVYNAGNTSKRKVASLDSKVNN
jgi:hypothetical protein